LLLQNHNTSPEQDASQLALGSKQHTTWCIAEQETNKRTSMAPHHTINLACWGTESFISICFSTLPISSAQLLPGGAENAPLTFSRVMRSTWMTHLRR
jgi:hypothetical protein